VTLGYNVGSRECTGCVLVNTASSERVVAVTTRCVVKNSNRGLAVGTAVRQRDVAYDEGQLLALLVVAEAVCCGATLIMVVADCVGLR
jgi:hypothetical protein